MCWCMGRLMVLFAFCFLGNYALRDKIRCWVWKCTMEPGKRNSPVWQAIVDMPRKEEGENNKVCMCVCVNL